MPAFLKLIFSISGILCIVIGLGTLFYHVFDFFHIVEPYFWLWLIGIILIFICKITDDKSI